MHCRFCVAVFVRFVRLEILVLSSQYDFYVSLLHSFSCFRFLIRSLSRGTHRDVVVFVASNDVREWIGVVGINPNARRRRPADANEICSSDTLTRATNGRIRIEGA